MKRRLTFKQVLMNSTMWASAPTSRHAIHFTFNNHFVERADDYPVIT